MHSDCLSSRAGLSVLEVLMAVGLTAVAILGATGILLQLQSVSARIVSAESATRSVEARSDLLRLLVAQVVAPRDTAESFRGGSKSASFVSMCRVARGFLERCRATVRVVSKREGVSLSVSVPAQPPISLASGASAISLLYRSDSREGGKWLSAWDSSVGVPLGIGIVRQTSIAADTVFLRIGPRG